VDFTYSYEFEAWLQSEIAKLEREGIIFALEPVIRSVGEPYGFSPWAYQLTGIRYVLSLVDGIADYIYDVKEKKYCRLPLYKCACVLIKYGDLLIGNGGWSYVSKISVFEALKKKYHEVAEELKKLSRSRSKTAMELSKIYEKDLTRIEKALAYLSY